MKLESTVPSYPLRDSSKQNWLWPIDVLSRMVEKPEFDAPAKLGVLLTLSKVPAALAVVALAEFHLFGIVAALILLTIVIDIADGMVFARSKLNDYAENRRARRVVDTLSDRFLIFTTVATLTLAGILPGPMALIIASRELVLAFVVGTPYIRFGQVLSPNIWSKIGCAASGVLVMVSCFGLESPSMLIATYVGLSIVGFAHYLLYPRDC